MSRLLSSVTALAALRAARASAKDYGAPRLPDGTPDYRFTVSDPAASCTPFTGEPASTAVHMTSSTNPPATRATTASQARLRVNASPRRLVPAAPQPANELLVRSPTSAQRVALLTIAALSCKLAVATPLNCFGVEFRGKAASVCKADVRNNQLRLFLRDDKGELLGSLQAAARLADAQGQRLQFAMNAGMFHPDFAPVGLLVIDGREISPLNLDEGEGNFFLRPNGVFLASAAGVRIVPAEQYPQLTERVTLATQSGPLLLVRGKVHPKLDPYSKSRVIRNGVGVQGRDQAVFVISEQPLSLYEFAMLFRDRLQCTDALYFDGVVSSLLSVELRRNDRRAPLGPIIGVSESLEECGQPSRSLAEPECLGTGSTRGPEARR